MNKLQQVQLVKLAKEDILLKLFLMAEFERNPEVTYVELKQLWKERFIDQ